MTSTLADVLCLVPAVLAVVLSLPIGTVSDETGEVGWSWFFWPKLRKKSEDTIDSWVGQTQ